MAKFCRNCGAQLQDGQICACQQQYTAQQPATQYAPQQPRYAPQQNQYTPSQQAQYYQSLQGQYIPPAAPAAPSAAGIYMKRFWILVVGLFKAPYTTGAAFAGSADIKLAFGLIGTQVLAVALLLISLAGKINSVIALGGVLTSSIKISLPPVFFVGAACAFGLACLMPLILLFWIKVFKGNTTYKHLLCVSAINSIMTAPLILLAVLLSLVLSLDISVVSLTNPLTLLTPFSYPLLLAFTGFLLGTYATMKSLKGATDVTDDKSVYVMFLSGIVMMIAFYLTIKIASGICIPSL